MSTNTSLILHVWAPISSLPTFDPESLALCLLIAFHNLPVEIHSSSNTLLGDLPALLVPTEPPFTISGYTKIVHYLKTQSMLVQSSADLCMQVFSEKLTSLSLYLLFECAKNYEKVTRPSISSAVSFPMQYNLTIELQRAVKERSQSHGLYKSTKSIPEEKGVSKTHEKLLKEKHDRQKAIQGSRIVSSVVAKAEEMYIELEQTELTIGSPAYCIVAANLMVQSADLPDPIFKSLLATHPKLLTITEWAKSVTPVVHEDYSYNLMSYLRWKVSSFWA